MNCRDSKDFIRLCLIGKLAAQYEEGLQEHLKDCAACAAVYERMRSQHIIDEDEVSIPLPDWEKSWAFISDQIRKPRKRFERPMTYRIMLAGAAACFIFIMGLFFGRSLFGPADIQRSVIGNSPVQAYFETLEPILIDFMNPSHAEPSDDLQFMKQEMLIGLIAQTRLFRRLLSSDQDGYIKQLLEDLEFILISISNLRPGDLDSADQIHRFIRDKDLYFRLRQLSKSSNRIS